MPSPEYKGMTRTSLLWGGLRGHYADGYDESGRTVRHTHQTSARAASSMDTTIHDYVELLAADTHPFSSAVSPHGAA